MAHAWQLKGIRIVGFICKGHSSYLWIHWHHVRSSSCTGSRYMSIQSMPHEILTLIITEQLLPAKDRARLGGTCQRSLHEWSEKSPQWRALVEKHFSHKWQTLYRTAPASLNFARIYALETAVLKGSVNVSYTLMRVEDGCDSMTMLQRFMCVCMLPIKPSWRLSCWQKMQASGLFLTPRKKKHDDTNIKTRRISHGTP